MGNFFSAIYLLMARKRWLLYGLLIALLALFAVLASRLKMDEEISRRKAGDPTETFTDGIIRQMKLSDKIIVHLFLAEDTLPADPERLVRHASKLADSIKMALPDGYIESIQPDPEDTSVQAMIRVMSSNIPLFLEEEDYRAIDSMITPEAISKTMRNNIRLLNTPAGMFVRERIKEDPLGMSNLVLKKLRTLQSGDQYIIYQDYIFTRDHKHLLLFINSSNSAGETARNGVLVDKLNGISRHIESSDPGVLIQVWGGPAIGVGNAVQLKKDVILTLSLALLLIFLLTGWYFRSILIPLYSLLPALFGGVMALALMYLIKGTISAIALGIGSVLLGLIVDYALYIIIYYRNSASVTATIKDLSQSIIVCCLTSAGAFLCLLFLDSAVLYDLGLFASFSLAGAALFALLFLPHFLNNRLVTTRTNETRHIFDRISRISLEKKSWLAGLLILASVVSLFFAGKVGFERDMNTMNYLSSDLSSAGRNLDSITDLNDKTVYLVTSGSSISEAVEKSRMLTQRLDSLKEENRVSNYSGVQSLLIPLPEQARRIERWRTFWDSGKINSVRRSINSSAKETGIKPVVFDAFLDNLGKDPDSLNEEDLSFMVNGLLREWITKTGDQTLVSTIVKVPEKDRQLVYQTFASRPELAVFDRQYITDQFVGGVRDDFNRLVTLTMIFVTALLIFSFGRIETGLIAAIPMFVAWLLTLGFMGVTGIRFNIFNIIISSFVFGLGVDYSILMARGMLQEYRTGENVSRQMKVSILLSSATTIIGVAVLLLAKHPALYSIAWVSIVGVSLVVLVAFTLEAAILSWILPIRKTRNKFPLTLRVMFHAIFIAWIPIALIAVILVIYAGLIAPLIPLSRKRKEKIFHLLFSELSQAYIALNFPRNHKVENPSGEDFSKPCIIISNHQSLIETPALLRLHPKILILASEWVFHNFVFGPVARAAGFIPISEGIDNSIDIIRKKISEGYSILIFPEGHRSRDGHIQRFHKGAFYLAEKLELDMLPVLIFGSGDFLRKGDFWGKPSRLFMKIMPRIHKDDISYGTTYVDRAKKIRRFYQKEYEQFRNDHATVDYYRKEVILNYVFKGPILEWYVRIKLRLEENFKHYDEHLPEKGNILDLGCGYGYMSYMLLFTKPGRNLTGIDYDREKISIANQCYGKTDQIRFICDDAMNYPVDAPDGIILGDILHYLEPRQQSQLLQKCMVNLSSNGVIMIREGTSKKSRSHNVTRITEFLSTNLGFNKTKGSSKSLYFMTEQQIRQIAAENHMNIGIISEKRHSSNTLFKITHAH